MTIETGEAGMRRVLLTLTAVLAVGVSVLVPAGASAESLCTDTWSAAGEGEWQTAMNWSTGKVPTSTDVACIGTGKTAKVTTGTNQTGVVQGKGTLVISGGSLELANALEPSSITSLTQTGGTLTSAGALDVSGSLSWTGGTMSGLGSTVLVTGATGSVTANVILAKRTLINEGTFTFGESYIEMQEGAQIKNTGTFNANSEGFGIIAGGEGPAPLFVNTGTFQKTAGVGTTFVKVNFENKGTVNAKGGAFDFNQPSTSVTLASGSVLEGSIGFEGPSVTGNNFSAPSGTVTLQTGTLTIPSGNTATVANFVLKGTLTGAGTLKMSSSFTWAGGTMSGSGSTVLGSSVSMSIGGGVILAQRTLVNEGTLTFAENYIEMQEGAQIKNMGTFNANSEGFGIIAGGEGPAPLFVNTGTFQKTAGTGTTLVRVNFENKGTVNAKGGAFAFNQPSTSLTLASGSALEGSISFEGPNVTGNNFNASGTVTLQSGSLTIPSGNTATIANFVLKGALTGAGTLNVSHSLTWTGGAAGTMSGSGQTVVMPGATGSVAGGVILNQRTLVNEGTLTFGENYIEMQEGAQIKNTGTFNANSEGFGIIPAAEGLAPLFINTGTFQKTAGTGTTVVAVSFENFGSVIERTGKFEFQRPVFIEASTQWGGSNPSTPGHPHPTCGKPVSCATGNFYETQTDLSVGGRGVGLALTRTYNSQSAAAGNTGTFGPGWSSSFSDHLVVEKASKKATLVQGNASTVVFTEGEGGTYTASASTQDSLIGTSEAGYTLTLADQTKYKFAGASGRLESVTDRNGNTTTLTYSEAGRLEIITDPAGRKLTLAYNVEGLVESAKDPMGHLVKYAYEGGNLKSVTEPGEVSARWQFKYDGSHQITEMIDGRGGKTVNEYNASHQAVSQKDPMERTLTFEYEPFHTKITNKSTGSVIDEHFTSNDEPSSITHGFGTSSASTETFSYDAAGNVLTVTDGNERTTKYEYDGSSNKTKMVDPNKNETKWTYDTTHDVGTITTPKGETTTIKRDIHGNPETVERPAPSSTTQITKYKYGTHGEVESLEDPLKRVWKYEYDTQGDRKSETDPEGNKRTWEYNEDSQETSTVSPRGNVTGGKPTEFTTKIERDAQGRQIKVTDPLSHTTKYTYDGDGNLETSIDGNSHTTKHTYDADNEPTKVEAPNKAITETGYDGAGKVTSQIDGNKHETKYTRNALEQVTEVVDPLGRKTTKEYDLAGNLKKLTDPTKRTTTYTYDPANRPKEAVYSSGKPATVKYEYDKDGDRTSMTDGTGTSKYTYDQLDRLTEAETGHKEKSKYEYDLANEKIKITYPNTKAVTRAFDKDGRLEKITDWSLNVTKFTYDPDSNQATILFPAGTTNEDKYVYNNADQMSEVKMLKGAESLASLVYTRDNDGQIKTVTSSGLPGEEKPGYEYDTNNRLTKGATVTYEYDPANNPTKIGTGTYKYNAASQLETGPSVTYTYDELGERTKTKPTTGSATTYGYDQAGNLTSVERPIEGEKAAIKDTYAYDGNNLRASQTISGTTSYLTWDMTEALPLLLNDGTNSYIYGPAGLPVEQISNGGTVTYLHHDQQGSTRLLTGSTGTSTGTFTYDAYGNQTGHTGTATTPLGYDGQYTSSDTGLIYLRARTYDPQTAQFLSADPIAAITRAQYPYSYDNPLTYTDPLGLWPGEGVVRGAVDVIAVIPYGVYYVSYQEAKGINSIGAQLGPGGSAISHVVAAPLLLFQGAGLTIDAGIDAFKGQIFGSESICDEGVGASINPLHSFLPGSLQGPKVYLPGIHPDGSVDVEW